MIKIKILKEQASQEEEEMETGGSTNTEVAPEKPDQIDCSINSLCPCVDRSIGLKLSVLAVKRALKELGFDVKEDGKCDNATKKAIMDFQKQQRTAGFKPIDGQPHLRCDACVGVNTSAAINSALKAKGSSKTLETMLSDEELASHKKTIKLSVGYHSGDASDLEGLDNSPLKGDVVEYAIPGQNVSIIHNVRGSKGQYVKDVIDSMVKEGMTNPYIIIGVLGTVGKESGYRIVHESARYRFSTIKNRKGAVAKRVWRIFKKQGFGDPKDKHIKAITGGGRNGPALFNIAYGYSEYQEDERITMPVLVNDEINPKLYDPNLAGFKYRGTGPIQNTFKENHRKSAAKMGIDFNQLSALLSSESTRQKTAIKLSIGSLKLTHGRLLRKYGKEPQSIIEGLQWAISAAGGPGFPDPLKPGTTLHKQFKKGVPFITKFFRLKKQESSDV